MEYSTDPEGRLNAATMRIYRTKMVSVLTANGIELKISDPDGAASVSLTADEAEEFVNAWTEMLVTLDDSAGRL